MVARNPRSRIEETHLSISKESGAVAIMDGQGEPGAWMPVEAFARYARVSTKTAFNRLRANGNFLTHRNGRWWYLCPKAAIERLEGILEELEASGEF